MNELLYVDDLKSALQQLGEIETSLVEMTNKKQILRDKIRQWMDINSVVDFQIEIQDNVFWKLTINKSERRSIDYDVLKQSVSQEIYNNIVSISNVETFKCQPVKTIKSKYSRKEAPKEN